MLPKLLPQKDNKSGYDHELEPCSLCSSCGGHQKVDLSGNEVMRRTLLNLWDGPSNNVTAALTAICVQCVYKLNAHKEIGRTLEMRLKRRINGSVNIESSDIATKTEEQPTSVLVSVSDESAVTKITQKARKRKNGCSRKKQLDSSTTQSEDVLKNNIMPCEDIFDVELRTPPLTAMKVTTCKTPTDPLNIATDIMCTPISISSSIEISGGLSQVSPEMRYNVENSRSNEDVNSLVGNLSVTPVSRSRHRHHKKSVGYRSSPNELVLSITPPPYSPHVTSQQSLENSNTEKALPTDMSNISSPRLSYVVEVEDITPEKYPTEKLVTEGEERNAKEIPLPVAIETETVDGNLSKAGSLWPIHSMASTEEHAVESIALTNELPISNTSKSEKQHSPSSSVVVLSMPLRTLSDSRADSPHSFVSSTSASQANTNSMLEIVYERPESILVTESGGRISRNAMKAIACDFCSRVYTRKSDVTRHARRCSARMRYVSSRHILAAASTAGHWNNDNLTSEDLTHNGTSTATKVHSTSAVSESGSIRHRRLFHCPDCAVTVESRGKLRDHRRIHLQRYYCDVCGGEFTAPLDFEYHRVICAAKATVTVRSDLFNEKMSETILNETPTSTTGGPITRSRSRAVSVRAPCSTIAPNSVIGSTKSMKKRKRSKSKLTPKLATVRNKKNVNVPPVKDSMYFGFETDFDGTDDNDDDDEDNNDGYDDDDCDSVSVADTMYSKRMRFTGNWLVKQRKNPSLNLYDEPLEYDEDMQITTYKEYDLYLLERLKLQVLLVAFSCLEPDCEFHSSTIVEMMVHDYVNHYKRAWFYCWKCDGVFTSKVFLDYHLDRQNGGRFICYKCGDIFEFQNQLDRHVIRHTKSINYSCNYCKFEFLTEHELLQHCEHEQHDPNSERKLIQIVREMTIVNEVLEHYREVPRKRGNTYCVFELNLHTVDIRNSGRPFSMSDHKPFKRRIGDVEFKNQKHPNCAGWKK